MLFYLFFLLGALLRPLLFVALRPLAALLVASFFSLASFNW